MSDKQLVIQEVPKKRGRPRKLDTMSVTEVKATSRERMRRKGLCSLEVWVGVEVRAALRKKAASEGIPMNKLAARILRDNV